MAELDAGQYTAVSVQILQRECDRLNLKVQNLEKQLQTLCTEKEKEYNNSELVFVEHIQIQTEIKERKERTEELNKELNSWEASIRQPLQHYKDMKEATNDCTSACPPLKHILLNIEASIQELKKSNSNMEEELASLSDAHDANIQQATMEKRSAFASLQTQLKIIETRKKTMQSQLQQKIEDNKGLTTICEELIRQRE